jgi:hypothetical protein
MFGPLSSIVLSRHSVVTAVVFIPLFFAGASTSSSTTNGNSITTTYPAKLHGIERDPFVQSAPLVVAIACRNGVVIVSATSPSTTSDLPTWNFHNESCDSEPLLYYNANDIIETRKSKFRTDGNSSSNSSTIATDIDESNVTNDTDGYPFLDLPDTFAGPYRIQSIGATTVKEHGSTPATTTTTTTAFVSCGWKADGYIRLLNMARDILDTERSTFGEECNVAILANQLSLYMAKCAVSERVR